MILVVHEGIDCGPEAHPVPYLLPDVPPDGPVVPCCVLDGVSALVVTPVTYSATTECPLANWVITCITGSFSFAFLDPLLTTDLVTLESVFSKNVTGEGHCLATTVNE